MKVYTNLQDQQDMSDLANVDPTLGTLAASGTATFDRPGYHTVPLEQLGRLHRAAIFSIVVQISGSSPYLRVIGLRIWVILRPFPVWRMAEVRSKRAPAESLHRIGEHLHRPHRRNAPCIH